jgi:hypothetical protein
VKAARKAAGEGRWERPSTRTICHASTAVMSVLVPVVCCPSAARGGPRGALLDGVLDRGWGTRPYWPVLGCGRWTATTPGGAGADRGRHRRSAVVDGVQGPGGRSGAAACAERALGCCWAAATGACCWWPWARPAARPLRPWPPSRPPRHCRLAFGRIPAPPAGHLQVRAGPTVSAVAHRVIP